MNIYFLRHGQTDLNIIRALQGQIDMPLNAQGKQQAQEVHQWVQEHQIHFDAIFSSPLDRAKETASIVTGHQGIHMDSNLLEINYGPYEGKVFSELNQDMIDFLMRKDPSSSPEGVESLDDVQVRANTFMSNLRLQPYQNVLIVTHGVIMRSLFRTCGYSFEQVWKMDIENCHLYRSTDFHKPIKQ